jgi:hypothetical protein
VVTTTTAEAGRMFGYYSISRTLVATLIGQRTDPAIEALGAVHSDSFAGVRASLGGGVGAELPRGVRRGVS